MSRVLPDLNENKTFLNPVSTAGLFFFRVESDGNIFEIAFASIARRYLRALVGKPQSPDAAHSGMIGIWGRTPEKAPLARGERNASFGALCQKCFCVTFAKVTKATG